MNKRKGIAFLAMLVMVFGLVFPKAAMTVNANTNNEITVNVQFNNTGFNPGGLGNVTITSVKGGEVTQGQTIPLTMTDTIVLNGFDADKMECVLVGSGNFTVPLTVSSDGTTSLGTKPNDKNYPNETMIFEVRQKQSGEQHDEHNDEHHDEHPEEAEQNLSLVIKVGDKIHTVTPEDRVFKLDTATVPEDFAFEIEDVIDNNDNSHHTAQAGKLGNKSGVEDNEGRNPLEIQTTAGGIGKASWTVNLIYHKEDDPTEGNPDIGFYIRGITFSGTGYRGVEVSGSKMPDMYQDTVYTNNVDLGESTESNPVKTAVYYDSGNIELNGVGGKTITKVEAADGSNNAITVSGSTIKFTCGFYASAKVKVTLDDGTVGYIEVDRLGIGMDVVRPTTLNPRNEYRKTVFHGSQNGSDVTKAPGYKTVNIVATFYYDAAESYKDYDMVANLTFADGHTETKVVEGFGEVINSSDNSLKAGDYLVWAGDKDADAPTVVSVTAVKHGATSATKFGGALFGAGKGVTKENIVKEIPN
ncbi:MAG: hypothetical protein K5851_07495 [Lachnospiraceae bacterium]|nr:hypothetical protein [Lachnospiraceae bacterium]